MRPIHILVAELDGAGSFDFALTPCEQFDHRLRDLLHADGIELGDRLLDEGRVLAGEEVKLTVVKSREEALTHLPNTDLLIAKGLDLTERDLDQAKSLKFVQIYGEDARGIDLNALTQRGIRWETYTRLAHSAVAEQALLLMLATMRDLPTSERVVREAQNPYGMKYTRYMFNWAGLTTIQLLRGKTLGIIGMGEIGRALSKMAGALGMNVVYTQRRRLDEETEARYAATYLPLEELMKTADVISLHVPLVQATIRLIGERELSLMKPTAVLINTARSRIVDQEALYQALVQGRLRGAGLDVYDIEPVQPGYKFAELPNVVLTPHVGGAPISCHIKDVEHVLQNCLKHYRLLQPQA